MPAMLFKRVFIANRGVVARRIARACAELGIESVAAHSDLDRDAPHVAEATASARLPGFRAEETYLNADRIIAEAQAARADALHPGYGFLAENPDFARRVAAAGIVFVGPSPEAIEAFGEKTGARRHMREAGFPVAAGSDLIEDEQALIGAAHRIGWPVMLKPAAGGGGIGMRVAGNEAELVAAFASTRALAEGAFGNAAVYLEALLKNPRHIEFQMLGDGTSVRCVGERECSVQRRHQKVIEEAPAPSVAPAQLSEVGNSAAAALEGMGYASLGTVETLLAKSRFAFLEVNTRLQVEHGVTEEVTGLDLVQSQIRLAAGERLDDVLPADSAATPQQGQYAVQARIYAEDSRRMLPSTGTLSPGRTNSRSPTLTASSGTSSSPSSVTRRAVLGARSRSARIAPPVRSRAVNSNIWPTSTSIRMTAAASK